MWKCKHLNPVHLTHSVFFRAGRHRVTLYTFLKEVNSGIFHTCFNCKSLIVKGFLWWRSFPRWESETFFHARFLFLCFLYSDLYVILETGEMYSISSYSTRKRGWRLQRIKRWVSAGIKMWSFSLVLSELIFVYMYIPDIVRYFVQ